MKVTVGCQGGTCKAECEATAEYAESAEGMRNAGWDGRMRVLLLGGLRTIRLYIGVWLMVRRGNAECGSTAEGAEHAEGKPNCDRTSECRQRAFLRVLRVLCGSIH
jgi:hypothetical protein